MMWASFKTMATKREVLGSKIWEASCFEIPKNVGNVLLTV